MESGPLCASYLALLRVSLLLFVRAEEVAEYRRVLQQHGLRIDSGRRRSHNKKERKKKLLTRIVFFTRTLGFLSDRPLKSLESIAVFVPLRGLHSTLSCSVPSLMIQFLL